jgi:hypothetical protein
VTIEWDAGKAASNLRRHDVDFADAAAVFHDPLAITIPDPDFEDDRFITIGSDVVGRLLIVVYTWRDDALRIISARHPTPRERRAYEG